MLAITFFGFLASALAAADTAPLSYGQWAQKNPGASRAERRQALAEYLQRVQGGSAQTAEVKKVVGEQPKQFHAAPKKPQTGTQAASYGEWLRLNPGKSPAERRAALKSYLDTVYAAPKQATEQPTASNKTVPVLPADAKSKWSTTDSASYGHWLLNNQGKSPAERRTALASWLDTVYGAAQTKTAAGQPEHTTPAPASVETQNQTLKTCEKTGSLLNNGLASKEDGSCSMADNVIYLGSM